MNQNSAYSYDKEADVLSISFSPDEKPTAAVELNDNILLRFHRLDADGFFRIGAIDQVGTAQFSVNRFERTGNGMTGCGDRDYYHCAREPDFEGFQLHTFARGNSANHFHRETAHTCRGVET